MRRWLAVLVAVVLMALASAEDYSDAAESSPPSPTTILELSVLVVALKWDMPRARRGFVVTDWTPFDGWTGTSRCALRSWASAGSRYVAR